MQESLWLQQQTLFQGATLQQDVSCDICVIGGGMTGIQTALRLAKAGFHVIVIEAKSAIGLGATGLSTGKLTSQHGAKLSTLSLEDAKTYYTFNDTAITAFIETLPETLYQEVTSFIYTTTEEGNQKLQQEAARYEELHIPFFTTNETELPFPITCALGLKKQYQCNPAELLQYSAKQATEAGATIYTSSRATKIYTHQLELENGCHITFNQLFVCTHYPIASLQQLRTVQLSLFRSYLTASPIPDLMTGQYMGIDSTGRTVRTALLNDQSYLFYGGGNHRVGTTATAQPYYDRLTTELRKHFDIEQPDFSWSSQDIQTPTQLPFIEQVSDNMFIATGYDKWGLSNSIGASELLLHYATEQPHPAKHTFCQTNTLSSWAKSLQSAGFISLSFIESYLAHATAPKCTHLGCKTHWNEGDQTWDCPCHGSRFSPDGQVLEGPAVYPLKIDTDM